MPKRGQCPTRDLLNTLAAIAGKGAGFRSLGDTWTDTTTPHGRLMLTVLGGLAEFERELIRVRTSEGRSRAKVRRAVGRNRFIAPFSKANFQDVRTAFLDEPYFAMAQ
jgi:DNA invertase Pin-like site-specific DNA recombinase